MSLASELLRTREGVVNSWTKINAKVSVPITDKTIENLDDSIDKLYGVKDTIGIGDVDFSYSDPTLLGIIPQSFQGYNLRDVCVDGSYVWTLSYSGPSNKISKLDKNTFEVIDNYEVNLFGTTTSATAISMVVTATDVYVLTGTTQLIRYNKATMDEVSYVTVLSGTTGRLRLYNGSLIMTKASTSTSSKTLVKFGLDLSVKTELFLSGATWSTYDGVSDTLFVAGASTLARYNLTTMAQIGTTLTSVSSISAIAWDSVGNRLIVGRTSSSYYYTYPSGNINGSATTYTSGLLSSAVRALLPLSTGEVLVAISNAANPIIFINSAFSSYTVCAGQPFTSSVAEINISQDNDKAFISFASTSVVKTLSEIDLTTKTTVKSLVNEVSSALLTSVDYRQNRIYAGFGLSVKIFDIDTLALLNTIKVTSTVSSGYVTSATPFKNGVAVAIHGDPLIKLWSLSGVELETLYSIDMTDLSSAGPQYTGVKSTTGDTELAIGWWSNYDGRTRCVKINETGTALTAIVQTPGQYSVSKVFVNEKFCFPFGSDSSTNYFFDFNTGTWTYISQYIYLADFIDDTIYLGISGVSSNYEILKYDMPSRTMGTRIGMSTPSVMAGGDYVVSQSTLLGYNDVGLAAIKVPSSASVYLGNDKYMTSGVSDWKVYQAYSGSLKIRKDRE